MVCYSISLAEKMTHLGISGWGSLSVELCSWKCMLCLKTERVLTWKTSSVYVVDV